MEQLDRTTRTPGVMGVRVSAGMYRVPQSHRCHVRRHPPRQFRLPTIARLTELQRTHNRTKDLQAEPSPLNLLKACVYDGQSDHARRR